VLSSQFVFRFGSGFGGSQILLAERLAHVAGFATLRTESLYFGHIAAGILCARQQCMGVHRFTELRAWQACDAYKRAVYRLCSDGPLSKDWSRRSQLEESVSGPPGHVAEGFGRFNSADFARFLVLARSFLMESQNHLRDAVDKRYITEEVRLEHDTLAEAALEQVTGLME